jgi:hypothetical protein
MMEIVTGLDGSVQVRRELMAQLFVLAVFGKMEEYMKYVSAYLYARHLRQELPLAPSWFCSKPEYFVSGILGRRMRTILRPGKPSKMSALFAYSCLQVKRGCAPVDDEFIIGACQKFHSRVGVERIIPEDEQLDAHLYRTINRIVEEVFHEEKPVMPVPSGSAHYESGRKDGGAFGYLSVESTLCEDDLWFMWYNPQDGLRELRVPYFEEKCHSIAERCYRRSAEERRLPCRAQALCEPFKVRTITAGPAEEYFLCKAWQKVIHGQMRKYPAFALTGEPMDDGHVYGLAQRYKDAGFCLSDGTLKWVSADYEAATDNIDPEWSDYVMCRIAEQVGAWGDMSLLRRALKDHEIEIRYKEYHEVVTQKWGQLMGSPISFPILCILNAAACITALEIREREKTGRYRTLPLDLVLVNGDDALLMTDSEGYEIWKRVTSYIGLKMSVGKNYFSDEFIMLNSQQYLLQQHRDSTGKYDLDLIRIPYVNLGLLSGQKRVVQKDDGIGRFDAANPLSDIATLADYQRELLKFHWNPRIRDELTLRLILLNKAKLKTMDKDWFISEELGGVGLVGSREMQPVRGRHMSRAFGYYSNGGGGRDTRHCLPEYALMSRRGLPSARRAVGAYPSKSQGNLSLAWIASGNTEVKKEKIARPKELHAPAWFRRKVRDPFGTYVKSFSAVVPTFSVRLPIVA